MQVRTGVVAGLVMAAFGGMASAALAVTPGWECVPTNAGQPVVSGGTGSTPTCTSGTPVLAPTYVASGVGGKPTVEFSTVNVQIVDGAGSTSASNGKGNLVIGYDEGAGTQTGSHNLVLGEKQSYTRFAGIVGGYGNTVSGAYAAALGLQNTVSGNYGVTAGGSNTVSGTASAALGGLSNTVSSAYSSATGGCSNLVGTGSESESSTCTNTTTHPHDFASITGGAGNQATGIASAVDGGDFNLASDPYANVLGGCEDVAGTATTPSGNCLHGAEAVLGGFENTASGLESTISGGDVGNVTGPSASVAGGQFNSAGGSGAAVAGGNSNSATGSYSAILGGFENNATTFESAVAGGQDNTSGNSSATVLGGDGNSTSASCQSVPATPGTC